MTYAATAPSLCVLEKLVHLDLAIALPEDLVMVEIEVPDGGGVSRLEPSDLPERWAMDDSRPDALEMPGMMRAALWRSRFHQ